MSISTITLSFDDSWWSVYKVAITEYNQPAYEGAWTHWNDSTSYKYKLHAGRATSGYFAGYYYFSKLSFNTGNLTTGKIASLTMSHTLSDTSNPYGTSAILTASELDSGELYAYEPEAENFEDEGYVAWTHCDSHFESANQSEDTVIYYTFEDFQLQPNTTYYVYIKRRIGLTKDDDINGWTEFYNPLYSESYATLSSLVLTYASGGHVNIHNGTEFKKYIPYIHDGSSFKKYVPYIHNGTKWVKYSG